MKTKTALLSISAAAIALLFLLCTSPTQHAGNGSDIGNAAVVGKLYQPDGQTPAVGIKVVIRAKRTLADTTGLIKRMAAVDTITTDSAGRYAFDSTLDTGTYVIEAASGNDAVLIDSVAVTSQDSTDSLPPDTLKPAGAIKGVIGLSEGGDPRKVFVLAFGIDRFARVNADGSFRFSGLAEAKYDLRLISSLDNYGVLDTVGVQVRSADTTNLDTVWLPFTGIPTPKGLTITYDTLKQIVILIWNKADTALVKSYNVYRRNIDSNTVLSRINTNPIMDTVYKDSNCVQDMAYEYEISAVNHKDMEGTKTPLVNIQIVSGFVSLEIIDSINGATFKPFGLSFNKNHLFIADSWAKKIIETDTDGNFISSFGSQGADSGKFEAPHDLAIDSNGNYWIADFASNRVQKLDSTRKFLTSWSWVKNLNADSIQIIEPTKIAIDNSNSIYILQNSSNWEILKITEEGMLQMLWKIGGNQPIGFGLTRYNQMVICPDGKLLKIYDRDSVAYRQAILGANSEQMLTVGPDGLVYAYNSEAKEMTIHDLNGAVLSRFSIIGDSEGDIVVSDAGRIFIGSLWPGKIEIFKRR
jgi:hypothetical protein